MEHLVGQFCDRQIFESRSSLLQEGVGIHDVLHLDPELLSTVLYRFATTGNELVRPPCGETLLILLAPSLLPAAHDDVEIARINRFDIPAVGSLDELQDAAYPALCAVPLTRRVVGGPRLLGWPNESIAELFSEALQPLEPQLHEGIRLEDAYEVMGCFRRNLCKTVSELDGKSDWLCALFKHTNDALCELDTLKTLTELCERPLAIRCARPSAPDRDKYGWLREQWRPLAATIRSVIEKMGSEP